MGFIDVLKSKFTKHKYATMLSGGRPVIRQSGGDVYSYDVVQQALACIAAEVSKLCPRHVTSEGADMTPANDPRIQTILRNPNDIMTTSDFLEKITNVLFLTSNAFILPAYDSNGKLKSLFPIAPAEVTFMEDAAEKLYIKFRFRNNYEFETRYTDVIHIRHNFALNDYMGGDINGNPDLDILLEAVELNSDLLQSVKTAVKNSFSVNGVIKYNTLMDEEKMTQNLNELTQRLENNESGFLPMDLKGEFIPINKQVQLVDEKTLEFIDSKILRHFGVSLPILTGDYTTAQYDAFFQKTIEPLVIKLNQAFTKTLFTATEKAHGNNIIFMARYLNFMTIDQKLEMVRLLGDAGDIYENEKRVIFGMDPLPELAGKRTQSLNYVDVDIANKYQLNRSKQGVNYEKN